MLPYNALKFRRVSTRSRNRSVTDDLTEAVLGDTGASPLLHDTGATPGGSSGYKRVVARTSAAEYHEQQMLVSHVHPAALATLSKHHSSVRRSESTLSQVRTPRRGLPHPLPLLFVCACSSVP